jgi:hypothetical protein
MKHERSRLKASACLGCILLADTPPVNARRQRRFGSTHVSLSRKANGHITIARQRSTKSFTRRSPCRRHVLHRAAAAMPRGTSITVYAFSIRMLPEDVVDKADSITNICVCAPAARRGKDVSGAQQ